MTVPRLVWESPAERFEEATPLGNGAIGAIVYGGSEGRVGLNDSTAWSGTPEGPDDALAAVVAAGAGPERLAEARAAVDAGDHDLAEKLLMTLEGPWSQEFLPLGDLRLGIDTASAPRSYSRRLDLIGATIEESFSTGGVAVRRDVWVDRDAGALIVVQRTSEPLTHVVALDSPLPAAARVLADGLSLLVELPVDGAPAHEPQATPLRWDAENARERGFDPFVAVAASRSGDGSASIEGGRLLIADATVSVVALVTESNGRRWWRSEPTVAREELLAMAIRRARETAQVEVEASLREHRRSASAALGASTLTLGAAADPDDVVVRRMLDEGDQRVIASVMYAFGRYLLWSSSSDGSPPANLQGIWNASLRPAWSSNYTININTEMNYWAAERTSLADTHIPLFTLLAKLHRTGTRVASELYGVRGWVAHHNTDPWGFALPAGDGHGAPSWAYWPMGGLWLSDHLWQHWRYGLDDAWLRDTAWPILRGAAEFALDWAVPDGRGGLRTVPSTSPENAFVASDGSARAVTSSVAMDISLIRATLEHAQDAAKILAVADDELIAEISSALAALPDVRATPSGILREWGDDREAVDPQHRHMSQMVAVYPLGQITPHRTPELAEAARATLDERGPGAMGWSWAWKIANRARLGQGDIAAELFAQATTAFVRDPGVDAPVDGSEWGGLLPNLFSTHPPFQIDGNLGFPAAIVEMLVGPGAAPIRLLPALPSSWPEGRVTGVRVEGGISLDLAWRDGRAESLVLRRDSSSAPDRVEIDTGDGIIGVDLPDRGPLELSLRRGPQ